MKALVYVDAYIPDQGQTLKGLTGAGSCFAVSDLNSVFNFVPIPGAPAADPDVYGKADTFTHCFTNGLPAATANVLAATQRPLAARALTDPSGTPAWKTIPSWAVIGLNDHIIPAASQITMAEHAKSRITKVSAPHLSMLANPDAVTGVILEAAHSAS